MSWSQRKFTASGPQEVMPVLWQSFSMSGLVNGLSSNVAAAARDLIAGTIFPGSVLVNTQSAGDFSIGSNKQSIACGVIL